MPGSRIRSTMRFEKDICDALTLFCRTTFVCGDVISDGAIFWTGPRQRVGQNAAHGWNSWDKYACKGLNEKVVRETADAMATNGMKDAGYQFVILDDCWQTGR